MSPELIWARLSSIASTSVAVASQSIAPVVSTKWTAASMACTTPVVPFCALLTVYVLVTGSTAVTCISSLSIRIRNGVAVSSLGLPSPSNNAPTSMTGITVSDAPTPDCPSGLPMTSTSSSSFGFPPSVNSWPSECSETMSIGPRLPVNSTVNAPASSVVPVTTTSPAAMPGKSVSSFAWSPAASTSNAMAVVVSTTTTASPSPWPAAAVSYIPRETLSVVVPATTLKTRRYSELILMSKGAPGRNETSSTSIVPSPASTPPSVVVWTAVGASNVSVKVPPSGLPTSDRSCFSFVPNKVAETARGSRYESVKLPPSGFPPSSTSWTSVELPSADALKSIGRVVSTW